MTISSLDSQFGPLQPGFSIDLNDGYTVLAGQNDVGKSAILQLAFRRIYEEQGLGGPSGVCLISPERIFVASSTETGGRKLEDHNSEFYNALGGNVQGYESFTAPVKQELPKLLLNHDNFITQLDVLKTYLKRMELPEMLLRSSQAVTFEEIQIIFHGSGLRSIFTILAALTDPKIKVVLIDEPELSLEPKLQKLLRNLLYDVAKEKMIIVSTHSHLFVNLDSVSSNYIVKKDANGIAGVNVEQLTNRQQLNDLVFNLLGNSLEDLFFPNNFMVVEGSSDQVIIEKSVELMGIDKSKIKILSARSINNTENLYSSIINTLIPLETNDSPYASKAVVLIDKPSRPSDVQTLSQHLGTRLIKLPTNTIEGYIPEDVYTRIGKIKADELAHIENIKDRKDELRIYKTQLSQQFVGVLTLDDVNNMPKIKTAIEKAFEA